ncbi:ABC transporter ATP-binding protein [Neobacillus drentensis]|uniref:ABC transporter ATP-binding protein n=1 Tax=Neobacillus drentensis TaxID=220684 RepID=UPI0028672C98|nr:ABC transporter ATP-binding protein [Neobacillus drentensis]MDR7238092.1 branched-chain amino acid transport system ATP-binding protein [Neobacillus drentensis]
MALLQVQNLSKRFGGVQAVDTVSFSVKEDQIYGLIGPNGAGKSTTFNLLTSMIKPDSGKVIFKDKDISNEKPHKIAMLGLGRTFQHVNLFSESTVLDNILMANYCRISDSFWGTIWKSFKSPTTLLTGQEKAFEILKLADLENYADELAKNLDHGHQGMLQIAIALATEPQLLLLDEPMRGMNPIETEEISDFIIKIKESGTSVLIIEHDMKAMMKICDQLSVIVYGKKIAEGTPDEIRNNPEVINAYLGSDNDA